MSRYSPIKGHSERTLELESRIAAKDAELAALRAEVEQLQVQLAGCGVAALGGTNNTAKAGDYGWSPAYQDTLDLRIRYESLRAALKQAGEALEKVADLIEAPPLGEIKSLVELVNKMAPAVDAAKHNARAALASPLMREVMQTAVVKESLTTEPGEVDAGKEQG